MSSFLQDLQSGLTLTLVSVPTSVAYASLAGLPGIRGLTTPAFSLMAFGLVTKVKWLASGATSITAVTVKADLEEYGLTGKAYIDLVCLYALLVGFCSLAMGLSRMGALAKAIPKSVMSGFKWGAACVILTSQAPDCFLGSKADELGPILTSSPSKAMLVAMPAFFGGLKSLLRLFTLLMSPLQWRGVTAGMSFLTVWFLKGGSKAVMPSSAPQGSEVLLVCVLATVASLAMGYSTNHGATSVIGPNPMSDVDQASGAAAYFARFLPDLDLFQLPWHLAGAGIVLKAAIFSAVDFSATVAICATFEQENGLEWDANRELVAQGVANLVAGATGCQPVGGSLTRSLVTRLTNAHSPRAACINGLCMLLMLPVLWVIEETPRCVLAAVVLSQIGGTIFDEKRSLRNLKGPDLFLGFTTAAATAATSPTMGIIIGCVLAGGVALLAGGGAVEKIKKKI